VSHADLNKLLYCHLSTYLYFLFLLDCLVLKNWVWGAANNMLILLLRMVAVIVLPSILRYKEGLRSLSWELWIVDVFDPCEPFRQIIGIEYVGIFWHELIEKTSFWFHSLFPCVCLFSISFFGCIYFGLTLKSLSLACLWYCYMCVQGCA